MLAGAAVWPRLYARGVTTLRRARAVLRCSLGTSAASVKSDSLPARSTGASVVASQMLAFVLAFARSYG